MQFFLRVILEPVLKNLLVALGGWLWQHHVPDIPDSNALWGSVSMLAGLGWNCWRAWQSHNARVTLANTQGVSQK